MIRGDLSNRLVHLTKGDDNAAFSNFQSILKTRRLIGSSGHIKGLHKCVCFSEAPVSVIAQMCAEKAMKYKPLGVMVDKAWLFKLGGRPVIYQSDREYEDLPEDLRYRHVRYEPPDVDFAWEREWRVCGDVELHPESVTLVVPSRGFVDFPKEMHMASSNGDSEPSTGFGSLEWHFIALEDLGVTVDF
jgi:hypothetical protein